jgi:hypothetical protein
VKKDVKMNVKDIPAQLHRYVSKIKPYVPYMVILLIICTYGFMLLSIKSMANSEPSEDAVAERLSQIKQPKVDQSVVDKLQQLQDQNVQVQALFDQARDNPFEN